MEDNLCFVREEPVSLTHSPGSGRRVLISHSLSAHEMSTREPIDIEALKYESGNRFLGFGLLMMNVFFVALTAVMILGFLLPEPYNIPVAVLGFIFIVFPAGIFSFGGWTCCFQPPDCFPTDVVLFPCCCRRLEYN